MLAMVLQACAVDSPDPETAGPSGGKADDGTATDSASFLGSLPGWGRYIALDKLDDIVPVYLAQTRTVLDQIDALPAGTVTEATKLDEVPIPDLFAAGNTALLEVLDDADFAGGRRDHDVAWLRQSAVELASLGEAVDQLIVDGTSPASFDAYLTNTSLWHGDGGAVEIDLGIAAVSRFYCNLDVRIVDDPPDGFYVSASESCD